MSTKQRWEGPQRRIGLTGGIASGKSSVGKYLTTLGLPVLDADIYAHEALAPGTQATGFVIERYGCLVQHTQKCRSEGNAASQQIDRRALGQIVFNDAAERLWLEQLIHPIVRKRLEQEIELRSRSSALVLIIPLLFEAGLESLCSEVWLVHCSPTQQRQRLMTRNRLSPEEAEQRIRAQWPMDRKTELADCVIKNGGVPRSWTSQVRELLSATPPLD